LKTSIFEHLLYSAKIQNIKSDLKVYLFNQLSFYFSIFEKIN